MLLKNQAQLGEHAPIALINFMNTVYMDATTGEAAHEGGTAHMVAAEFFVTYLDDTCYETAAFGLQQLNRIARDGSELIAETAQRVRTHLQGLREPLSAEKWNELTLNALFPRGVTHLDNDIEITNIAQWLRACEAFWRYRNEFPIVPVPARLVDQEEARGLLAQWAMIALSGILKSGNCTNNWIASRLRRMTTAIKTADQDGVPLASIARFSEWYGPKACTTSMKGILQRLQEAIPAEIKEPFDWMIEQSRKSNCAGLSEIATLAAMSNYCDISIVFETIGYPEIREAGRAMAAVLHNPWVGIRKPVVTSATYSSLRYLCHKVNSVVGEADSINRLQGYDNRSYRVPKATLDALATSVSGQMSRAAYFSPSLYEAVATHLRAVVVTGFMKVI